MNGYDKMVYLRKFSVIFLITNWRRWRTRSQTTTVSSLKRVTRMNEFHPTTGV